MDAATPDPARIGPYRLEQRLGAGGMGEVHRAWDERLRRPVALKQIRPELAVKPGVRARFLREARTAAQLTHPNVVRIYDVVTDDEHGDWIVMELAEGEPLNELLASGPLPVDQVLALGLEIVDALAAAHAAGIVHRDLKTENVIVAPGPHRAKILDFGLAKQLLHAEDDGSLSAEGAILGTPRAMSPEQIMGQPLDHRSDLFSLGVLLYEMLTATSPFRGSAGSETMRRVLTYRQVAVRELRPEVVDELSGLVDHLLEKDPCKRPESAEQVGRRLRRIADLGPPAPADDSGRELEQSTLEVATEPPSAERRQLTILCCALVRPGQAGTAPDPETLYRVRSDFQALVEDAVGRFEGHLVSVLGHRLVICFGYPRAHEDGARRAVATGLRLVSEVGRLRAPDRGELALRVGIHTGVAVVPGGEREQPALGPSLDVATALRDLATPEGVVVSDATYRLIRGFFTVAPPQSVELAGCVEPVVVRRVLAARDVASRTESSTELTPLVGREQELALLASRWQLTRDGVGQVVLLSGEAGIGKSRLVHELRERLGAKEARWLIGYGSPHTSNTPLHPVIGLLRRSLKLDPELPADQRRVRLEELVRSHDLPADATARLARLLALPFEESDSAPRLSPEQARKRTLEALAALVLQMAERQPVVLVIEDLHWADPTTLELLGRLIEEEVPAPLFVLLTFRPSFQPPWGHRPDLTQLHLSRLSAGETALLVDRVGGEGALPAAVRDQIVAHADGIPLFVEELTRQVTEGQRGPELTIPATLQDSLTAQLDRLGAGKEVAELAAVCGREFSFELLAAASPLTEDLLRHHLERLIAAQLIQRRGRSADQRFRFRHALLQEAALNLLLRATRQGYHHRLAAALEERFPAIVDGRPEIVGHHWELAGRPDKAVAYFEQAAAQARDAYANAEAIAFYRRALELDRQQEEPKPTGASDLAVRICEGLGDVLARTGSDPQARDAYEAILARGCAPPVEARIRRKIGTSWNVQRCKQEALAALARAEAALGPQPRPTPAWWWEESIQIRMEKLSVHYYQAEVAEMTALMENLEPLVPRHGTPLQRAELFTHLLERNLRRERYRLSEETLSYARAALAAYEEVGQSDRIADAKFNVGFVLLFRNQLDEALEVIDAALALARRLGIASLEGICLAYRTLVYRKRGEVDETRRSCSEIIAGKSPVRQPEYLGLAHGNLAWAAWRTGSLKEVEEHAAAALRCWQQATVSYAMQWPALLPLLAARLAAGQIAAAVEYGRRLLEPAQEQLAPPLAAILAEALAAWEQEDADKTRDRLTAAVGLARDLLYL